MTKLTLDLSPTLAQRLAEIQTQLSRELGSPVSAEDALSSIITDHCILNGGAATLGLTLPEMVEELMQGGLVLSAAPHDEGTKE